MRESFLVDEDVPDELFIVGHWVKVVSKGRGPPSRLPGTSPDLSISAVVRCKPSASFPSSQQLVIRFQKGLDSSQFGEGNNVGIGRVDTDSESHVAAPTSSRLRFIHYFLRAIHILQPPNRLNLYYGGIH
jgi:hypothetical protein